MIPKRRPYTFDRVFRIFLSLVIVVGVVLLFSYLSGVLIPFAIALLLAYLIDPIVIQIQKKVPNRLFAVLITFFSLVLVFVGLCIFLVPIISSEIKTMGELLSKMVNDADWGAMAEKRLNKRVWLAIQKLIKSEDVQAFFNSDNLWSSIEAIARKVLPKAYGLISGTVSFVFLFLAAFSTVTLYLLFLLMDFQKVRDGWCSLLPQQLRAPATSFARDFNHAMNIYFRAQALVASIVGILFAIGFGIIGLPMGILLGLFIGLLNMVPYLQIVGVIPAVFLSFMLSLQTGGNFWLVISEVLMIFVVVQTIQEVILIPRIMGKVTGLSPAMILLSLSIWGKLLGILGLLIALPVTCLLLAYYRRIIDNGKSISEAITEGDPESVHSTEGDCKD